VSGSSTGVHALGHVLDGGSYLLGAANVWDGRGEVYWNRTRVYTGVATNPHIPPPPETNAPNVAQVGTNTLTTWRYPLDTNEKKTRLQALYLAGQIGKSGVITSLAIYVSGYPTITLPEYTIRLAHTPINRLANPWATRGTPRRPPTQRWATPPMSPPIRPPGPARSRGAARGR